jgi:hypothetical protein
LAIQIGTSSPVYGFTAKAPVKTPSLAAPSPVRSAASVFRMRWTNASTSARRSGAVTSATSGCSGASTT